MQRLHGMGLLVVGMMVGLAAIDCSGEPRAGTFPGAIVTTDKAFVLVPPPAGQSIVAPLVVSDDGRVVVGVSGVRSSPEVQFGNVLSVYRWSSTEGARGRLQWLEPPRVNRDPMALNIYNLRLSEDASTLVGAMFRDSDSLGLFRWDSASGMTDLGDIPGHGHIDVSSNGATLTATADGQAFRWTRAGGRISLGQLPGDVDNEAARISADGSVIFGNSTIVVDSVSRIFRWTAAGGIAAIDLPADSRSCETTGYMSDDGSSLFGVCQPNIDGQPQTLFRWSAASGSESISVTQLPNTVVNPVGVSRDGSVLVGKFVQAGPPSPAAPPVARRGFYRWTAQSGVTQLTPPVGLGECSYFDAMTRDGSVVLIGCDSPELPSGLVKWDGAGTAGVLDPPPGFGAAHALGVTADGHVVAGYVDPPMPLTGDTMPIAVLWDDRRHGPVAVAVADFLREQGIATAADLQGLHLRSASVSPDGHTLTGEAIDVTGGAVAWLARLP